ncbi:nucleotidyltransferase family protein [Membranihabitans maritimus]|uniref:nucleotidyltransferase family protein n=1 Tax=Membranihabitans maritimus TaxID=2904244 RepID=UPI001F30FAE0|nr:nucleotidyltransferase family protein [Membranihabitans maritimus]
MFLTKNDILSKLKEVKPILFSDYSVKEIGLFGSSLGDSFNKDSDIDLLVELKKPIGWKFFSLQIYLERLFDRKVDLVTKNGLKKQLRDLILEQVQYI